jgi:hypothetical protein
MEAQGFVSKKARPEKPARNGNKVLYIGLVAKCSRWSLLSPLCQAYPAYMGFPEAFGAFKLLLAAPLGKTIKKQH